MLMGKIPEELIKAFNFFKLILKKWLFFLLLMIQIFFFLNIEHFCLNLFYSLVGIVFVYGTFNFNRLQNWNVERKFVLKIKAIIGIRRKCFLSTCDYYKFHFEYSLKRRI